LKFVLIAKRFLAAFFVFIYYPGRSIFKFIFYKFLIKIYSAYISFAKKTGWKDSNILSSFLSQKMTHITVLVITITLLLVNVSSKTRASAYTEKANNTILRDLIKSDFMYDESSGQYIVESFDREAVISAVQQSYLDNLGSFRAQPKASLEAEDDDDFMPAQVGTSLIKPELSFTQITPQARTEIVKYIVQPGDTISTIAAEFSVSVNTILWENNLSAYSIIRPGNEISILPTTGIKHEIKSGENLQAIANKYSVELEKIVEVNNISDLSKIAIGDKLIIPDGKKIIPPAPARTPAQTYTGFTAIKDIVKPADAKPVASNKMNWPTVGSRITQYYSWRHTGLDIADKTGTAIYAADAGTIEYAGWGTGYGNQIVINHGGGKKTRYAHLSKFHVGVGDKVSKGETIGAMGSTGWSTGPHLHFEVIINGVKYNPLNYIR
jgi:murein DD-endopeptidase MepM/ murein hydrolase activator NlpD